MTKHLTDRPNHICKVIQEKGMWVFLVGCLFFLFFVLLFFCLPPESWLVFSGTSFLKRLSLVFNPADIKAKDQV